MTFVAGPNGSGKSTLIASLVELGTDLGLYLNADDIARAIDGPLVEVAAKVQQIVAALLDIKLHDPYADGYL